MEINNMSYNFSYKIYASEILRELHKCKDPKIVDKFINELKKTRQSYKKWMPYEIYRRVYFR